MLSCNLCDSTFESNFELYKHKSETHGPALGVVIQGKQPAGDNDNKAKYAELLDGENDVRGVKRIRKDGVEPPKKYRKVVPDDVPTQSHASDDDEELPIPKRGRNEIRGSKRRRGDADYDDIPLSKRRHIEKRGRKRYNYSREDIPSPKRLRRYESDSSDEESSASSGVGEKRNRYESDDDDEFSKSKRRKIDNDHHHVAPRNSLTNKMKKEIQKWKRLYESEKRRYKKLNDECEEQMKNYDKQLSELKEFGQGDYELDTISRSVINSVSVEDYMRIRDLISKNKLSSVLRSRKYLLALRKIFMGLTYGIIPVTTPQRIALSAEEKEMVGKLETATADQIRAFIKQNKSSFLKLFSVINDSIKLVIKSFSRYGIK